MGKNTSVANHKPRTDFSTIFPNQKSQPKLKENPNLSRLRTWKNQSNLVVVDHHKNQNEI